MAKLSTEKRKQLPDSAFGIPEKRMYPLYKLDEKDNLVPDKAHIESAVKLFGHASDADKPKLARNILKAAHEAGMDTSGWDRVNAWAKKESTKKNESKPVAEQHVGIREYTGKLSPYSSGMSLFDNIIAYADDVLENLEMAYYEYAVMMFPELLTMEQTAFIQIGNDMLITDEDYESFYEEAFLNDIDDSVIIEFDDPETIEEVARGPYDEYLAQHGYDPKTNTILAGRPRQVRSNPDDPDSDLVDMVDANGNPVQARVDAGRIGTAKQRNRMNAFLKRQKYDPKTGTIETDLVDEKGKKIRIPFGIHRDAFGGDMLIPHAYSAIPSSPEDLPNTQVSMDKRLMQRRPAVSTGVHQHEIGHIASGLDQNPYRQRDRRDAVDQLSDDADPILFINQHGTSPDEYVADRYAARHNPYDKTGTAMTHALSGLVPTRQATTRQINQQLQAMGYTPEEYSGLLARRPDELLDLQGSIMRAGAKNAALSSGNPEAGQYMGAQGDDMSAIARTIGKKGARRSAIRKVGNQSVDAMRRGDVDEFADMSLRSIDAENALRTQNARREAVAQKAHQLEDSINAARSSAQKLEDMLNSGRLTPTQYQKVFRKYQRTLDYIERATELRRAQKASPDVLREPKRIQPSKQERKAQKDVARATRKLLIQTDEGGDPMFAKVLDHLSKKYAKQLGITPKEFIAKAEAGDLPPEILDDMERLFDAYEKGDNTIFGKEMEPTMAAGAKLEKERDKRKAAEKARIDAERDKSRAKNPDRGHSRNLYSRPHSVEASKTEPVRKSVSIREIPNDDKKKPAEISKKEPGTKGAAVKQSEPEKKDTKKPTPTNSDKK